MEWFKFYGTKFLYDDKLSSLSVEKRSLWVILLCVCSINEKGTLEHYSWGALLRAAGITEGSKEWMRNANVLDEFKKLDMVTIKGSSLTVNNWEFYQQRNLTGYERVKKHREKQRNDNAMITHDNVGDNANDNAREEKKREEKKRIDYNDRASKDAVVDESVDEYGDKLKELQRGKKELLARKITT